MLFRISSCSRFIMFYAVKAGRKPGIYATWDECSAQVKGFTKPVFRKFSTQSEAEEFIHGQPSSQSSNGSEIPDGPGYTNSKQNIHEAISEMKSTILKLQKETAHISQSLSKLSSNLIALETACGTASKSPSCTPQKRTLSPSASEQPAKSLKSSSDGKYTGCEFYDCDGVEVYTDGSCFGNGKKEAKAGIGVFWGQNHKDNLAERLGGRPTNNRAEIHASRMAVETAKRRNIRNLILYTDSEFLINSITGWIKGWKRNGWKLASGKPVVNKEDFQQLDSALQGINVKWVHVRGHCGIPGNEAADSLANDGARKSLPELE